jgi:SAM-dependent methyltransferase
VQAVGTIDGVQLLTDPDDAFERAYLDARTREGWVYADAVVGQLPYPAATVPHAELWRLRSKNFERFAAYLRTLKQQPLNVLEIGCGNGWFAHAIAAQRSDATVLGLDVNLHELKQAARVFGASNPSWLYGDLFRGALPAEFFQLIVFNGALQYFADLPALFARVLSLLAPGGEVHILDSPLYPRDGREDAQRRTAAYYRKLGVEAMTAYYHAHAIESLDPYRPTILYDPRSPLNRLRKKIGAAVNPFPWIRLRR